MNKRPTLIAAVLLFVFLAGCIGTGTIRLEYELDEFYSSSGNIQVVEVDLTTNEDYNDNKDKIKSVDQVTVVGWLINMQQADNSAEIWLSDVGTFASEAEVRANATRVFVSPVIPGNDSVFIDWSDGLNHVENLPALKDAAEVGHFWLYGLADSAPFNVGFRIGLIIVLTAGL